MPTPAQLNALAFTGGDPFMGGFVESDWLGWDYGTYTLHGKPFEWWKSFKLRSNLVTAKGTGGETASNDELLHIKQTTAIDGVTPMDDVRCMVYSTSEDMVDNEFGIIPKGTTSISNIPSQVIFSRYDQVLLSGNVKFTNENLIRAATGDDVLLQSNIVAIDRVMKVAANVNGVIVPAAEYSLASGKLHWISSATVSTGDYYSVIYRYQPLYQWLEQGNQGVMQIGADGKALPQRGVLWEVK